MSARYSNSPALHLAIAESALCAGYLRLLALLCCAALWLLFSGGYQGLACGLILPCSVLWYGGWSTRVPRCRLLWRSGQWLLSDRAGERPIELQAIPIGLTWLLHLRWREHLSGRHGNLWLFADSLPREQFRQLRVRLNLQQ